MKKTSRKMLVPLIILALGMAIVSTVSAVDIRGSNTGHDFKPGQNPGPGPNLPATASVSSHQDGPGFDAGEDRDFGHKNEGTIIVSVRDRKGAPTRGASVYLDGKYKGSTDRRGILQIQNVKPGSYRITAEMNSHRSSVSDSSKVIVKPRKLATVYLTMTKDRR
jgi:hypothetical protein